MDVIINRLSFIYVYQLELFTHPLFSITQNIGIKSPITTNLFIYILYPLYSNALYIFVGCRNWHCVYDLFIIVFERLVITTVYTDHRFISNMGNSADISKSRENRHFFLLSILNKLELYMKIELENI